MRASDRRIGTTRIAAALAFALAVFTPAASSASEAAAAGHEAAAEGAHGGGHHEALEINWYHFGNRETAPILAVVINFLVLAWILVRFGKEPVKNFLVDRRTTMLEKIDEAAIAKGKAEGRLHGYQRRMKALDEEIGHLREDMLHVGHDERDRIVSDAGARAEKIRKEAEFVAAEEQRRVRAELKAKIVESAIDGARTSMREKLNAADHARLADAVTKQIEEGSPR
jgi:F-type H+-transporting ATPase subunit b